MFREIKLKDKAGRPTKARLRLIVDPLRNVISAFHLPTSRADLDTALSFGAAVAGHVQAHREAQRANDLDMLCDSLAAADGGSFDVSQDVPVEPVAPADDFKPIPLQDTVFVLPIAKAPTEIEAAHVALAHLMEELQTKAQEAEAKTKEFVNGLTEQLRTATKENSRLKGTARQLTSDKQNLTSQVQTLTSKLADKEEEVRTAREQCSTLSTGLQTAEGAIRELKGELSSKTLKGFVSGVVFAIIVGLIIGCIVYFAAAPH